MRCHLQAAPCVTYSPWFNSLYPAIVLVWTFRTSSALRYGCSGNKPGTRKRNWPTVRNWIVPTSQGSSVAGETHRSSHCSVWRRRWIPRWTCCSSVLARWPKLTQNLLRRSNRGACAAGAGNSHGSAIGTWYLDLYHAGERSPASRLKAPVPRRNWANQARH